MGFLKQFSEIKSKKVHPDHFKNTKSIIPKALCVILFPDEIKDEIKKEYT